MNIKPLMCKYLHFESHNIDSGVFLMCDIEEMTSMKASNEINICP